MKIYYKILRSIFGCGDGGSNSDHNDLIVAWIFRQKKKSRWWSGIYCFNRENHSQAARLHRSNYIALLHFDSFRLSIVFFFFNRLIICCWSQPQRFDHTMHRSNLIWLNWLASAFVWRAITRKIQIANKEEKKKSMRKSQGNRATDESFFLCVFHLWTCLIKVYVQWSTWCVCMSVFVLFFYFNRHSDKDNLRVFYSLTIKRSIPVAMRFLFNMLFIFALIRFFVWLFCE